MGFDKVKMKQIRRLIIFIAGIIFLIIYSKGVWNAFLLLADIAKPFLIGGAIAFVINIPMKGMENGLFKKWNGKTGQKLRRPVSLILTILMLIFVIAVVVLTIVPQITRTVVEVGVQIPVFFNRMMELLEELTKTYPQILEQVQQLDNMKINWETVVKSVFDFLRSGVGNMLTSTMSIASNFVGGLIQIFVAFIFAIYVLMQKEKLGSQGKRILYAYFPEKIYTGVEKVLALLSRNFSNFISGQCLEAVILGVLFVIAMSIFGMPYAVTVGVLIAFTALIPIIGTFVGCFVGVFLILINDPLQALWFLILFLILQQIEGNLIYPRVVGNSVGLPSIWVLVAVSVGGSLMGVVGILIFIPLVSTGYALLREDVDLRNEAKRRERIALSKASEVMEEEKRKKARKKK